MDLTQVRSDDILSTCFHKAILVLSKQHYFQGIINHHFMLYCFNNTFRLLFGTEKKLFVFVNCLLYFLKIRTFFTSLVVFTSVMNGNRWCSHSQTLSTAYRSLSLIPGSSPLSCFFPRNRTTHVQSCTVSRDGMLIRYLKVEEQRGLTEGGVLGSLTGLAEQNRLWLCRPLLSSLPMALLIF